MEHAVSACWPRWAVTIPLLVISTVALPGCAPIAKFTGAQVDAVKASIPGRQASAKPVVAQEQPAQPGTPVYTANECIGAVVNGRCHGSVIDTQPMRPRCYGQMIGGQCTGPMF